MLVDLREGSPNIYSAGLARQRGDRRDNRRQRDTKDQAARAYRFLIRLGASADEAIQAINSLIQDHCKLFGLPKFPILESAALRKRSATTGDLAPELAIKTLAMLGRPGPPFEGKLPKDDNNERRTIIRASCSFLLSGYIRSTAHVGEK